MNKVLLAEDDYHLRFAYQKYLEKNGFNVTVVADGVHAIEEFMKCHFDLVISDIMMPNVDGNDLIKQIRQVNKMVPIIVLTALDSINDKEKSFLSGADDYIAKPFEMKELVLRINALLKRTSIAVENVITLKSTILDYNKHEITINGQLVVVTKKEFSILFKLLSNPNILYSRETLMNEFWGYNTDSFDRTVDTHIATLRKKVKSDDFNIITVFGKGYKAQINE